MAKLRSLDFLIEVDGKQIHVKLLDSEGFVTNDGIDTELKVLGFRDATFAEGEAWEKLYHNSYLGRAIAVRGEKGNKGRHCMILTASGSTQDEPGYWDPLVEYGEKENWLESYSGPWLFLVTAD